MELVKDGELDASCMSHIKGTGMNLKKYRKIATFVDGIVEGADCSEEVLLEKFAQKCYANFTKKDGLRQAKKFLKVLFGNNLNTLVDKGCLAALKKAADNPASKVMRIVRLNKPHGSFTKKLDKYLLGETLGKGATSKVKLGKDEETGQEVALKILTDGSFNKEDLRKEIDILKKLEHPNVIKLYDSYDNVADAGAKTTTVIVLELATKGELFDFFMYTGFFQPPLARWFFKQMLAGLKYCHDKGVAHRDLKPENCLLGDGFKIKLVDFGFATVFKNDDGMESKMLTALGTPGYAAPEILKRKKYNKSVDIFSLGVILFITIAGFPPFQEAKPENDWWFHKLSKKKYNLFWKAHERTAKFEAPAKDLLVGMLAADPNDRWTIKKIENCDWFKGECMTQEEAVKELLSRKAKVEKDKINQPAADAVTKRGESTLRAPVIGTYKPPNAFYVAPGYSADDIRQTLIEVIGETMMGRTAKEYLITGDDTKPERDPEEVKDESDWNPWWDIAFNCEFVEEVGSRDPAGDGPPSRTVRHRFEAIVYIREDPTYKGDKIRHIVYFKRRNGFPHKWIKAMFKIQMKVGFFHVQPEEIESAVPSASPLGRTEVGVTG